MQPVTGNEFPKMGYPTDAGVRDGGRWRPKAGNARTPASGEPETGVRYSDDFVNEFKHRTFALSNDLTMQRRQAESGEAAHR